MSSVTTRRAALERGVSLAAQRHRLARGDWQRVFPGVYVTHGSGVTWQERVEAATLARGPGARAGLHCALHLWGLTDVRPQVITLVEPASVHRRRTLPGVRVRRRRRVAVAVRHGIPVTSVAQTVLDVLALPHTTTDELMALVARATRARTTAAQLREELTYHPCHPRRGLLEEVLRAAEEGLESAAELRYARDVEQAHGLPAMQRQAPVDGSAAAGHRRSRRVDFRDPARGVVVEIDGELYHRDRQHQDRARDRQAAGRGDVVLRAGWVDVVATPCELAGDVAGVLAARGWTGRPRPCSSACSLAREDSRRRSA
ncbi:hypothetical protein [Ornithinimicrobium pekingense]|uniref:DUF559 domain-containing protein n=1 Tax=Ornithinimicrobium pekingense TaxID=384677 RepID=A0ABQ2F3H8_9MICO|nr:hypothetical protein [Ornithinimicrobium pekingense]GGK56042.1 hypothetical protein GCM10011509_00500 [Ornithinimicrobium pekingense]